MIWKILTVFSKWLENFIHRHTSGIEVDPSVHAEFKNKVDQAKKEEQK